MIFPLFHFIINYKAFNAPLHWRDKETGIQGVNQGSNIEQAGDITRLGLLIPSPMLSYFMHQYREPRFVELFRPHFLICSGKNQRGRRERGNKGIIGKDIMYYFIHSSNKYFLMSTL